MLKRPILLMLMTALTLFGCGQQQTQQHTTNPQYQTNQANPNIDCTPITNPNYVPGGNQAQYYYPEGCQPPVNNGYTNNSNIGGYVGAAAVGAAAGALANRAINNRSNRVNPINTANNNRVTVPPINRQTRPNAATYTPATNNNSSVYRQNTRTTTKAIPTARGRRR